MKSSTSVYGSAPRDPAVFTETTPPKSLPSGGFAKDAVEVEGYVRGFAPAPARRRGVRAPLRQHPGAERDSPLAEYFSLPVLPTVLGYDPRLQFVHEDDVIDVLRIAAGEPRRGTLNSGTFNVAGEGVLLLSQCSRRLGRPTVPVLLPAVRWVGSALRTVGVTDFSPEQIRLLTHGRVVSTTEMRETLAYEPTYTTAEAFADFARSRGPGLLPPDALARAVDRVAGLPFAPFPARTSPEPPPLRTRNEERTNDGGRQGHPVRRRPLAPGRAARRPQAPPGRRTAETGAAQVPSPPRRSALCRAHRGPESGLRRPGARGQGERGGRGLRGAGGAARGRLGPADRGRPVVPAAADHRRVRGRRVRLRRGTHRPASCCRCCGRSSTSGSGWRCKGVENIPADGGALVVANHSGTLPIDAMMTQVAVHDHHPAGRLLRLLGADLVFGTPVLGALARKGGHTLACNEDAERAAAAGRAGRGVAGGVQGHRQAVPRALQAPAVRPGRFRVGRAAHRHADHPGARSWAPRRSTR